VDGSLGLQKRPQCSPGGTEQRRNKGETSGALASGAVHAGAQNEYN
jgi:hypothetical protein